MKEKVEAVLWSFLMNFRREKRAYVFEDVIFCRWVEKLNR